MPRLFTNRPREYNFIVELVQHTKDSPRINWELSSAILYMVGGISFIIECHPNCSRTLVCEATTAQCNGNLFCDRFYAIPYRIASLFIG